MCEYRVSYLHGLSPSTFNDAFTDHEEGLN